MDHEFPCSKEEACQCWTVPDWLKVANNSFNDYARENNILNDAEICNDDANGFISDRLLPDDKKEEVSDEYFFDHLKDDNSEEDHGESEKYDNFNEYDVEG
jgi:hypothetical protein